MSKYYVEKRPFNKVLYREIVPGTEEMLNAYPELDTIVEIRHLDISYGSGFKKFKAIKDLNLNVYRGEVLGLVGESGSGKSTIGRGIIGLVPHEFGYIKVLNKTIPKNLNKGFKWSKKYKQIVDFMVNKIQIIFQDPTNSLNPYKNVEQVVGEGLSNTKNSRMIYLVTTDEMVFWDIYNKIKEIEPDKLPYKDPIKKILSVKTSIEDSYNFVFGDFLGEVEKRKMENPEKYTDIHKRFLELQIERDEQNKLTEAQYKRLLIIDILKQVGLDESVLGRAPLEFSGGQQQRLGICRAVVLQPKLLIADEPISALDVSIQAQVINIFNDLKKRYHLTILFIAHDLRMVEYISDRIAVINKGVLLEIGPTKEIINNPFHPYTKSLLDAVPSITSKKGSLLGSQYDPAVHGYDELHQPSWHDLGNKHFVLATDEEIKNRNDS